MDEFSEAERATLDDMRAIETAVDWMTERVPNQQELWGAITTYYRVDLDLLAEVIDRRNATRSESQ